MDFYEVVDQVVQLLQQRGRLTYRALKVQFQLDDATCEALKDELLFAHPVVDHEGRGLVWTGASAAHPAPGSAASSAQTSQPHPIEAEPPPQGAPLSTEHRIPDAERRQLTVLFCDLVNSTQLSSQLDPEDLRTVIQAYQDTCARVIARYDGHIAQYLGDGLLVYFGYPQAHEDDAQRAVRTGLGMLEAIRTLPTHLLRDPSGRLAVRIGIHTGLVVVGEMGSGGRHEHLALGDTPNLAARLQGLAAPNTVVISEATARLVHGYFTCHDLGTQTLKGLATPVHVSQVLGESAAQSRLDVAATRGLTPLVGREEEVGLLLRCWAQSHDTMGQAVLLSGEAGIGKSRLVHVLTEAVVDTGAPRLTLRCSPYYTNSAFYPIIEHLQRLLHWHREAPPAARLVALEQALQGAHLPLAEVVPLVAALLSLPVPERYPPLTLSPQRQKQKTQEALVAWLLAEAAQQPVLAIWEDLHWADPSTLELLGLLLDQVPTTRLCMVLTCRPEFRPPWPLRSYVTPLTLSHLTHHQVEELVLRVTGGKPLPAAVVHQIVAKTDGIPLFVEELVKTILESSLVQEEAGRYRLTGPLPPLAIPATLQDALMARLDRLAPVKEVAQLGAVLGREFAYEVLRAVAPLDEATVQQGLAQLVEAELLYQRGTPPQATYTFKHALIQDAAYQSLLRSTRQQYHQRIAHVLEAQFLDTTTTQPELLAHHYTEAGLTAQAIPYWQRAGQRAIERSAHAEAIGHLTKGLELLKGLPVTPEHTRQELDVQTALGPAWMAAKGYAAPEVEAAYGRARDLCQQLGETSRLFSVLRGLGAFYFVRGQYQTAREVGEELLTLAQSPPDPTRLLGAHQVLGIAAFWLGEFAAARGHLEQTIALYTPQQHRSAAARSGQDPGVLCRAYSAWALGLLGYPDQALERIHEAVALGRALSHPHSLVFALYLVASLHQLRRDVPATHEWAEATLALAREQLFPYWLAVGRMTRGWALAHHGQGGEGIEEIRQGLAAYHATGAELGRPWFLALLAEAYGKAGRAEEGLHVVAEGLAVAATSGEGFFEAEQYRLKGELLLAHALEKHTVAETCLQHALDSARRQQAKWLELRTAVSLSRLWQQQGKQTEARALLVPVYGWFTEGFDTADLQEAKALLEELGG